MTNNLDFITEAFFNGFYIEGSQYNGKNNKLYLLLFTGIDLLRFFEMVRIFFTNVINRLSMIFYQQGFGMKTVLPSTRDSILIIMVQR